MVTDVEQKLTISTGNNGTVKDRNDAGERSDQAGGEDTVVSELIVIYLCEIFFFFQRKIYMNTLPKEIKVVVYTRRIFFVT